jgi:hypothetical protein
MVVIISRVGNIEISRAVFIYIVFSIITAARIMLIANKKSSKNGGIGKISVKIAHITIKGTTKLPNFAMF